MEMSVIPSRIPICAKKLASSRDMGDQTWFSWSFPLISRTIWKPQRWGSPSGGAG